MEPYLAGLAQLGFTEDQLFNAQGNNFDRVAIAYRIQAAIDPWVRGEPLPRRPFPPPGAVLRVFDDLREAVLRAGLPTCSSPFPVDLRSLLLHGAGSTLIGSSRAAEDGRGSN